MTTVLSVGNSEGERRCDARCHRARTPECDCVCDGRFHGRGSAYAIEQVQQDVDAGVFGVVVMVDRPAQMLRLRETDPDTVRFHRRDVAKAERRLHQASLIDQSSPGPARVAGSRPQ